MRPILNLQRRDRVSDDSRRGSAAVPHASQLDGVRRGPEFYPSRTRHEETTEAQEGHGNPGNSGDFEAAKRQFSARNRRRLHIRQPQWPIDAGDDLTGDYLHRRGIAAMGAPVASSTIRPSM